MMISPVVSTGMIGSIGKDSPKRLQSVQPSRDNNPTPVKDTYYFSSTARQLSSQSAAQTALAQSNKPATYSRPSSVKGAPSSINTSTSTTKILSPKQKDFEAFMAGKSFQEEFSESSIERLQEKAMGLDD